MAETSDGSSRSAASNASRTLLIRLAVLLVVVVAAVAYGMYTLDEIKVRSQYNAYVTHLMDNGHYAAAVDCFTALEPQATGDTRDRIQADLAHCYVMLARSTDEGEDQKKAYLAQGYALNPTLLADDERLLIGK